MLDHVLRLDSHSNLAGFEAATADTVTAVLEEGGRFVAEVLFPLNQSGDQQGLEPDNWKPMPTIGPGVREIRVREGGGAFRVIYVALVADAVHVLHAFQKKSQKTPKPDLDLAARRLRAVTAKGSP